MREHGNLLIRPAALAGLLGLLTLIVPVLSLFLFVCGFVLAHCAFIWARRKRSGGRSLSVAIAVACLAMALPAYLVTEAYQTAAPIAWAPVSKPADFPEASGPHFLAWLEVTELTFLELFYSLGPNVVINGLIALWFLDFALTDMVVRILRAFNDASSRRIHVHLSRAGHLLGYEPELTGKETLYAVPFPMVPHVGTFRWMLFFGGMLFGPVTKGVVLIYNLPHVVTLSFMERDVKRGDVDDAIALFEQRSSKRKASRLQARKEGASLKTPDDQSIPIPLLIAGCILLNAGVVGVFIGAIDREKVGTTWPYLMARDYVSSVLTTPEKWEFEPLHSDATVIRENADGSFTVRGFMQENGGPRVEYSATVARVESTTWKLVQMSIPKYEFHYVRE